MTCLSKIEGSPACATCQIQKIIRQDNWGSNNLRNDRIPQGVHVATQPKDAWAGRPKSQVVYCGRGLGIPVE